MITINDVVHVETGPKGHTAVFPFCVTLHVPGEARLSPRELAWVQSAIVNAAHQIRRHRNAPGPFAWVRNGVVDWAEQEGGAK